MSEPRGRARKLREVVPGVLRWSVADDRIGGVESDAYAVQDNTGLTLVDPLPLARAALRDLGTIQAIALTAACHQRSAWRYRRLLAAPVHAPARVPVGDRPGQLLEEPDQRYEDAANLPGGLVAVHAPGPALDMYALWHPPTGALFVSDLLMHEGAGAPAFVPGEYQDDPALTRRSVRALHDRLAVRVLCFGHGPPITSGAREALARALDLDGAAAPPP